MLGSHSLWRLNGALTVSLCVVDPKSSNFAYVLNHRLIYWRFQGFRYVHIMNGPLVICQRVA